MSPEENISDGIRIVTPVSVQDVGVGDFGNKFRRIGSGEHARRHDSITAIIKLHQNTQRLLKSRLKEVIPFAKLLRFRIDGSGKCSKKRLHVAVTDLRKVLEKYHPRECGVDI